MPMLTISLDGRELQRVPLTRIRTTVGRRPYNDLVIEHLGVSGEHAVFVLQPDGRVQVLDLNSTNGTYVNGRAVVSADVGPDDVVEIARYQLRVISGEGDAPPATPAAPSPPTTISAPPVTATPARLEVLEGPAQGRTLVLIKPVTTIGKPGVAVASIVREGTTYTLRQTVGAQSVTLNDQPLRPEGARLNDGDVIALAGTRVRFIRE
ncbi:hypothetical protein A9O67_00615 [Tepidimonas fonticaldi]|uniref:FHA domain-containing protein n=1 Tax=Tepidimonas fonticaldi TaxID=1101373 RepID=A0A1A6DXZ9_9BURK|nr:FHA domain-containing protein [Tepidimonas fonticaldi]OBS31665.1 hypothetical protein A9O67_00615 [Tepidimonas fonticaldi]